MDPDRHSALRTGVSHTHHKFEAISSPYHKRKTFYVNVDWQLGATLPTAKYITGQMYVESLEPLVTVSPYPIILLHGDYHTGQVCAVIVAEAS